MFGDKDKTRKSLEDSLFGSIINLASAAAATAVEDESPPPLPDNEKQKDKKENEGGGGKTSSEPGISSTMLYFCAHFLSELQNVHFLYFAGNICLLQLGTWPAQVNNGGTIFNLGTASLIHISIWALNLGSQSE